MGEQTSQPCTVIAQHRAVKVVPCNSLYPFVCTTYAGKIIKHDTALWHSLHRETVLLQVWSVSV